MDKLLDSYRTSSNASGFQLYSSLTDVDKQKLSAAVKAVQEPLSKVAEKVTKPDDAASATPSAAS